MLLLSRLIIASLLGISAEGAAAETPDVFIRGATVIDGTGTKGFQADVAVKDGRIARMGRLEGTGTRDIDGKGLILAPGFIDVHTHAEGILEGVTAENFLRMGVTTVIAGNCGASEPQIGEYLQAIENTRVSANVATLIGHNTVRRKVIGETAPRAATPEELNQMKGLVERAMNDGAIGLSSGLIYVPGKFTTTSEVIELARVVAAHGGIYATHVRDEQQGLLDSLQEAFQVGRDAQIPVEISHLKLSGNLISPQSSETIRYLEQARQEGLLGKVVAALDGARQAGLKVSQDLYPYSGASALINRLLPAETRKLPPEELARRLKNTADRLTLATAMKEELKASGHTNYAHAVIVTARRFKRLQGLTVAQAAQERSGTPSLDAQITLIQDLALAGDVSIILYDQNEADLIPLMLLPNTMFISDAGTFQFGAETEHPRGYGSAARVLARYVRDENRLSMEEAIRKMTSLCAETFHLKDRGVIREGAWADLVLFDPAGVRDNATYASPHLAATGFKHVFVNGVETVTNDKHTGARAGKAVRRGQ